MEKSTKRWKISRKNCRFFCGLINMKAPLDLLIRNNMLLLMAIGDYHCHRRHHYNARRSFNQSWAPGQLTVKAEEIKSIFTSRDTHNRKELLAKQYLLACHLNHRTNQYTTSNCISEAIQTKDTTVRRLIDPVCNKTF